MKINAMVGAAGILLLSSGVAAAYPAVAVTDLNVRSGQGTGFPVIAVLPRGSTVDVTGCGDGWCYVRNYGGFASARYLDSGYSAYATPPVYAPGPVYRYRHYPYRRNWYWRHRWYRR